MEFFPFSFWTSKDCAFLKLLLRRWRRAGSTDGSGLRRRLPEVLSALALLGKPNIPGKETRRFSGGRELLELSDSKSLDSSPDFVSLLAKYFPGTENFLGNSGVVFESLENENNLPGPDIFLFGGVRGGECEDEDDPLLVGESFTESFESFLEKSPELLFCNLSSSSSESVDFLREKRLVIFLAGFTLFSSLTAADPVLTLLL